MDIFEQVKDRVLKKDYLTQALVEQWTTAPNINDLHSFLLGEGLLAELISEVFVKISNLPLYPDTTPTVDQDWFIEDEILWVVNPWSTRLNENILVQQSLGNVITGVGIFTSSEYISDTKNDQTWADGSDGVLEKVQSLVMQAYDVGASDIHIAPRTDDVAAVKFRVLGGLRHAFDLAIDSDYFALSNTLLQLAGKHAGIYNAPIDGKFIVHDRNLKINIRLAMMPVLIEGEVVPRFSLRVHGRTSGKTLKALNFLDRQIVLLEDSAKYSDGLILNTGPMGSGKTTTLYALLSVINSTRKGISIQTLEDPIEANLPNIDQTEINHQAGMTYAAGLRTMLRADANVMLIGEIRDTETANLAVEAAMTGHLVLSTLHARTAMGSIRRLIKLGVSTLDLADTLALIVAQRVIRKVCPDCSKLDRFDTFKQIDERFYLRYQNLIQDQEIVRMPPDGCSKCAGFGYIGRTLVAEVALIDEHIADMIVNESTMATLNKEQKKKGFQDLWTHGIELVRQGVTTLEVLETSLPRRSVEYSE